GSDQGVGHFKGWPSSALEFSLPKNSHKALQKPRECQSSIRSLTGNYLTIFKVSQRPRNSRPTSSTNPGRALQWSVGCGRAVCMQLLLLSL
ncbi:hypothetical protein QTP86_031572, partial [Hemibagrus guttatus]